MQVVATWTGSHANALQQALRMTNESYAEYLGVAVRTVAHWNEAPATIPQQRNQEILRNAELEERNRRLMAQLGRADARVIPLSGPQHE
jgi:DNA-binding transcriptional regulator YiaG